MQQEKVAFAAGAVELWVKKKRGECSGPWSSSLSLLSVRQAPIGCATSHFQKPYIPCSPRGRAVRVPVCIRAAGQVAAPPRGDTVTLWKGSQGAPTPVIPSKQTWAAAGRAGTASLSLLPGSPACARGKYHCQRVWVGIHSVVAATAPSATSMGREGLGVLQFIPGRCRHIGGTSMAAEVMAPVVP